MASLSASITQGCAATGGVLTVTNAAPGSGAGPNLVYTFVVLDSTSFDYGFDFAISDVPVAATALPNGPYQVRVQAVDQDTNITYYSHPFTFTVSCSPTPPMPGVLVLDSLSHTDETSALNDGTATIQASGGTAPLTALLVELSMSQPAVSGQPTTFGPVPASTYTLRVTDSSTPTAQVVEGQVTVLAYTAPVSGCVDEYAENFDPAATVSAPTCTYAPLWRSAWQPMVVRVAATADQTMSFIAAVLRIGFRPGHPLAASRPLGSPIQVRATVGPDGYANFVLGPYLHPQLGAPYGSGGYRLDINTETVDDLYVGYELRRTNGTLLEHGYAVNSAVPDSFLVDGFILSAFAQVPVWPGFTWKRAKLASRSAGSFGAMDEVYPPSLSLPCPANPLPVAWLNPQGGWDFWVFSGKPALGDDVSEGQQYREPATGQRRYSDPGEAYQTFKASSGVFKGDALLTGLRTLWRSPQAWAQLVPGGEWVPIVVGDRGGREVGRMGVLRNELILSFSLAAPEFSQGQ